MLFKLGLCEMIKRGEKTQTRRLLINYNLQQKLYALGWNSTLEHANQLLTENYITLAYQPGRGKKGVGFIHILKLWREPLQDISFNDMLCEGYPIAFYNDNFDKNPAVFDWFTSLWDSINTKKGIRWIDNPKIMVHEFELVDS